MAWQIAMSLDLHSERGKAIRICSMFQQWAEHLECADLDTEDILKYFLELVFHNKIHQNTMNPSSEHIESLEALLKAMPYPRFLSWKHSFQALLLFLIKELPPFLPFFPPFLSFLLIFSFSFSFSFLQRTGADPDAWPLWQCHHSFDRGHLHRAPLWRTTGRTLSTN